MAARRRIPMLSAVLISELGYLVCGSGIAGPITLPGIGTLGAGSDSSRD
jgi:hypothetical protein